MESEEKSLFQKLREHPTFRASSTYAVIAFITVQVISLIVSSFSLSESIIQGFIWASIIGFPIVLILSFIITSHLSTFKLLLTSLGIVTLGYLGWSFYWIQFVKSPQLEVAFSNDEYARSWIIARDINNLFPFIPQVNEALEQLGWTTSIDIKQEEVDVFWRPYGSKEFDWEFLGTDPDRLA